MISLVNEKIADNLTQTNCEEKDNTDYFFNELQQSHHIKNGEFLVDNYLEGPLSSALPAPESFPCKPFLQLFVRYNTPIPSSAAVERVFSLGMDTLKPKPRNLSDNYFEMLVFLKEKL